jgi:hypothetical protein
MKKYKKESKRLDQLPTPKHPFGFSYEQVKEIMSAEELIRFNKWMDGQTCSSDDEGNTVIYTHDVERFLRMERNSIPTYWD